MKRHSKKNQEDLYKEWKKSGEAKKAFALRKGINPSTFHYWIEKFAKVCSKESSSSNFDHIELEQTMQTDGATMVIRYPNGIQIEWYGPMESIHLLNPLLG